MDLPRRALGVTDLEITPVGFGAWATGGSGWSFAWGHQDDDESVRAIRHAVELGVNWVDTAAVYGLGHSESVVGAALKDLADADRPYVFTKCGLVWDEADHRAPPRRVGRAESIRREVDASLRRLGVERIDLYQMHWPPEDGAEIEEYWQVLVDLVTEGKIRYPALSNHGVAALRRAEAVAHVAALQPPLSPINRRALADVIPWCAEHGTGVIVYSPMQSGLLSGAFSAQRAANLPPDDWRARNPNFSGETLAANLALADALGALGRRHGVSAGSVAIAWTLAVPGVSGAIVGARSASQVDGWIDAARLVLSDAELEQVAQAIESTGAGTGPTRIT